MLWFKLLFDDKPRERSELWALLALKGIRFIANFLTLSYTPTENFLIEKPNDYNWDWIPESPDMEKYVSLILV